jgi:hypothetical protein
VGLCFCQEQIEFLQLGQKYSPLSLKALNFFLHLGPYTLHLLHLLLCMRCKRAVSRAAANHLPAPSRQHPHANWMQFDYQFKDDLIGAAQAQSSMGTPNSQASNFLSSRAVHSVTAETK